MGYLEIIGIVLAILVVVVVAILVFAAMKPSSFRVQRSASIQAPPEKIFPLIADFHNWPLWSPWEKIDPDLKRTHGGSPSGKGAIYEWEGNKKVGSGRMEITDATPPTKMFIKLDFLKPFEAHNTTEFTLEPQGNSTNVIWLMHGPQPFMLKVMTTLFLNMDKVVGKDFENGLASMKSVAES